MKKVKLLFITYTHSNGGGAEAVLTTLVNNLNCDKYEITILEFIDYNIKIEPVNENINLLPAITEIQSKNRSAMRYLVCNHPTVIKELFSLHNFDVIFSWNYQIPSFMLSAFINEKKVAWFHGDIFDLIPSTKLYIQQQNAWNSADKIVTISNNSLGSLHKRFPEFTSKASIVYNGIDINRVTKLSDQKVDTINLKRKELPLLVIIGRLDENKNHTLLIRAMHLLHEDNLSCNLIIVGTGEKKEALQKLIEVFALQENIYFTGYQENPYPIIKQCDIVCLTSLSEGFPTVICEGMVLGKPFVTTPVAGASDELANNGTCGLVSGYDAKEYAACLKKILSDKELYKNMSNNCKEHIQNFSIEKAVKNFDSLIDSLKIDEKQTVYEKKVLFPKGQFAHFCICSKFADIKFIWRIFTEKKSLYNCLKLGYYILRALTNVLLYPAFFLYYINLASKIKEKVLND